jgi:hypothetical protein
MESGCWTEGLFSSPWVGRRPMNTPVPRHAGTGGMTKVRGAASHTVLSQVRFVIPTEDPDFLLRGTTNGRLCGPGQPEPHGARGTH